MWREIVYTMQDRRMRLQRAYERGPRGFARLAKTAAALALSCGAGFAQPAVGATNVAETRLVAATKSGDGAWRTALVIDLPKGAITYWRNPGDAGVPPSFDFSGSANVARADVFLPAPTRMQEADGEAFGYRDRALYFVRVRPEKPDAPIRLALKLDYAVCEKLCVPARADLALNLPADAKAADEALVGEAERLVPRVVGAEEAAAITVQDTAGAREWRIAPRGGDAQDLFVEPPEGYFAETRRGSDGAFRMKIVERPKDGAPPKAPFRFTLQHASGAAEFSARLDVGAGNN